MKQVSGLKPTNVKVKLFALGGLMMAIALTSIFKAQTSSITIPSATYDTVMDITQLGAGATESFLSNLSKGAVLKTKGEIAAAKRIWTGSSVEGHSLVPYYLAGVKKPFLLFEYDTKGPKAPEISLGDPAAPELTAKVLWAKKDTNDTATAHQVADYIRDFATRFDLELSDGLVLQQVARGEAEIVANSQGTPFWDLLFILGAITAAAGPIVEKRIQRNARFAKNSPGLDSNRGVSLVEYIVLVSLLCICALASMQSSGMLIKCKMQSVALTLQSSTPISLDPSYAANCCPNGDYLCATPPNSPPLCTCSYVLPPPVFGGM